MKAVICLCAVMIVVIARPEDTYTSKYDGVDVKEILGNQRLVHSHIKCGLGEGKCSKEAKEFTSHIQEALENHCAKCTEKQQEIVRLVISHLIHHEPDYWRQLCAKYDPSGKYAAKYEEELKTFA